MEGKYDMRSKSAAGRACAKLTAGAMLMFLTSIAGAATTLVGGGATLPAIGYAGKDNNLAAGFVPITPTVGSLFGVYTANGGNAVTYCPTGSGLGMKIFSGNDPNFGVNESCGRVTTPTGFGGNGLAQPHFVGSDVPLSVSTYRNYLIGHGAGAQPMQLPAIASAIAIVFKKNDVTLSSIKLTEGEICSIFSGQITDWSELALLGAVPAGTTPGPINVVYRSDDSGTSFAFLNHLSDVCRTNFVFGSPITEFTTSQTWAGGFQPVTGRPLGAQAYISSYATSTAVKGSVGVTTAVHDVEGSIGYADLASAISGQVMMAPVTNTGAVTVSPLTGFGPTKVSVALKFDKVLADSVDADGRPVLIDLPLDNNGDPTSSNGCIAAIDPSSYSNPAQAFGSTNYPIIAISYLLSNKQGNGADAGPLRTLLGTPYDSTIRPSVTKIGRFGTGYAWLDSADLTQARIDGCIVN